MKKQNKNQGRIEKLRGLDTTNEDDQHKPHSASNNIDHIIKLNEELTAENSRLLEELDGITADKDMAEKSYDRLVDVNNELAKELTFTKIRLDNEIETGLKEAIVKAQIREDLQAIKSKWWYKLMTLEW